MESTTSKDVALFSNNEDVNEDLDAAVYRRAKQSVDELHRARKFEKSIKLKWRKKQNRNKIEFFKKTI